MSKKTDFTNNPLKIAVDGVKMLFQKAPMLALALAILSTLGMWNSDFNQPTAVTENGTPVTDPAMDPAVIAIIAILAIIFLFGALVIGSMLVGIFAYTSAELAKGREVSFMVAVRAMLDRLWSFVWLQLLIIVKVLLWALLFIVPGIIMAVRYSLANLSFFDSDKKLTGNAAIKDSIALTKGAWVTTFAAQVLPNLITLGTIRWIVDTGSKTALYRQFDELRKTGRPHPEPHTLSWVTLAVVIFLAVAAISLAGLGLAVKAI
ncbi:MAG TPA: hypothetical protein VGO98_00620 [Candidatus Saccharimonadales bacterium]|jgi:hypothetical protein|nr:hypothetical protein [Candidatus Saccharimonadales bacterium]